MFICKSSGNTYTRGQTQSYGELERRQIFVFSRTKNCRILSFTLTIILPSSRTVFTPCLNKLSNLLFIWTEWTVDSFLEEDPWNTNTVICSGAICSASLLLSFAFVLTLHFTFDSIIVFFLFFTLLFSSLVVYNFFSSPYLFPFFFL